MFGFFVVFHLTIKMKKKNKKRAIAVSPFLSFKLLFKLASNIIELR